MRRLPMQARKMEIFLCRSRPRQHVVTKRDTEAVLLCQLPRPEYALRPHRRGKGHVNHIPIEAIFRTIGIVRVRVANKRK